MDMIRVLRLYEFLGPRNTVEEQIKKSITREKRFIEPESKRSLVIRATTLGEFPEILSAEEFDDDDILLKYECGYLAEDGQFTMYFGPVTSLEHVLRLVPDKDNIVHFGQPVILKYQGYNDAVRLFVWNQTIGSWLLAEKIEVSEK